MKKTITVTVQASIEGRSWADNELIDEGGREHSVPMTKITTTTSGDVLVEVDLAEIVLEVARTALSNIGKRATKFDGKIRAKVLTSKTEEERSPSRWVDYKADAEGGES